jgi:hypothetical protein
MRQVYRCTCQKVRERPGGPPNPVRQLRTFTFRAADRFFFGCARSPSI